MELYDVLDKHGNRTGKISKRGKPLIKGEYPRIIHVWIVNCNDEFLISKRTPSKKTDPDKWEPTRGWVIAGEDSITAALREVKEELGVTLDSDRGILVKSYVSSQNDAIIDVWLFNHDMDISDVIFQPDDIEDIQWATGDLIKQLMAKDAFINVNRYLTYIDELFHVVEENRDEKFG